MTIAPDGVRAAADREAELHPTNTAGKPITAWSRRATTIEEAVAEINRLRAEVDELKEVLAESPF